MRKKVRKKKSSMIKFILQKIIVPIDNWKEVAILYEIKRSPKLIVQNALGSGGHLVVSSKEIFSIGNFLKL
jgi:hypothetical protein